MYDKNWNLRTNMTMLTDYYELTMMNGYLKNGMKDRKACFDLFFRSVPESGGYAVMAGVQQMIDYLRDLKFEEDDLKYLKGLDKFDDEFIDYLENFKFSCDVWAIPEGTPIFPGEPIVKVIGPLMQAQMIETMLLVTINHQSLIATKSSRIVRAAGHRPVMEFGARRAQGYDASVLGARAAYIAGVAGTSCTISAQQFGIPVLGTMAHSWVQAFPTEYDAFKAYAENYPDNTQLLVDTYSTLRSGIPNAIKVAKEVLHPLGKRLKAIRIDSGDLTYLTIQARKMLDQAGLEDCSITVSNAMDEYLIRDLLQQGAKIDSFGVGERLITSRAEPVFGGVYKLSAIESEDGEFIPRMKISDNPGKITNPASKELWRFYDKDTGFALADLITLEGEEINEDEPLEIFDPQHTWKRKTLTNFRAKKLLKPIFSKGKLVYKTTTLEEDRAYCSQQLGTLWDSIKRFENPQVYYVDLSEKLWNLRQSFLSQHNA
ncbi:MAG TPA: nicotinate phosphoribosyltransferase [Candidatus Eisenbacteria bacterium]|nr:nicotinate phosphoribosyltransferase [Candidatus Eisenbacteria bacterium]